MKESARTYQGDCVENDKSPDCWRLLGIVSDGNSWKSRIEDQYDLQSEGSGAHAHLTMDLSSHSMVMTLVTEHQIKRS